MRCTDRASRPSNSSRINAVFAATTKVFAVEINEGQATCPVTEVAAELRGQLVKHRVPRILNGAIFAVLTVSPRKQNSLRNGL